MTILEKIKKSIKEGNLIQKATRALLNRIIKRIKGANIFYVFDKKRVATKRYLQTIPTIDSNHIKAGNYYIDKRVKLNNSSVVYSLGILTDISFDQYIRENFGCHIFMYDPTPEAIEYMNKNKNDHYHFFPWGVWTEETTLKFYEPKYGGSSSVFSSDDNLNYFEAKCYSIEYLMKLNKHDKIDLFKADIEGAALPILEQMISNSIFPNQIIVEFESPKSSLQEVNSFFNRIDKIRSILQKNNFLEYQLPRKINKYNSLELLFVNSKNL